MALLQVICSPFLRIIRLFRSLLCFLHIVRRRKNSGTLLPLHNNISSVPMSVPNNDIATESWDTWGFDDVGSRTASQTARDTTNVQRSRLNRNNSCEPEEEVDYFQELNLEPDIKKTRKMLVKTKSATSANVGLSSRLAMSSDFAMMSQGNELGTIDDADSSWSNEAMEDLTQEAEHTLREKRRLDRERKLAEHQQKKMEKESIKRQDRNVRI